MQRRPLGRTGSDVSVLCLGTMTFGQQNTEAEAHAQLDRALAAGIDFIDTAELYPVPPLAATQGRTEEYIGSWLARRGCREHVFLASKVVGGTSNPVAHLRGGEHRLDRRNIEQALEASLRRLKTDRIDLYQLHWPDRRTNFFGQLGYTPHDDADSIDLLETLQALDALVKAGKIRHIGVSNETPWGLMRYLALAEQHDLPRMASIQNPYNLLNRSFEIGLAEVSMHEHCGLLAYSPLAFGALSGKYLDGQQPPGARLTLFERFSRYSNPESEQATARYVALARERGLDPAQMALAFVTNRPFVTASIIGATTLEQLDTNIASLALQPDDELLAAIEAIHRNQPNPAP